MIPGMHKTHQIIINEIVDKIFLVFRLKFIFILFPSFGFEFTLVKY